MSKEEVRKIFKDSKGPNPSFTYSFIQTPVADLVAVADDKYLYVLEFMDGMRVGREVNLLSKTYQKGFVEGENAVTKLTKKELDAYFDGKLKKFSVPLCMTGTPFQKKVWEALLTIPYGETRSYEEQAEILSTKGAVRAVGSANGRNLMSIIIPCHRVINKSGKLGGYGGGLDRKAWLLDFEKSYKN